jgi:carboxypeptidase Taq
MQDIHWPSGWLGYFPSYTNGAIIASMLMKSAQNVNPEVKSALKFGDFSPLNNYLNENLRSYASSKDSADLLEISTGHRKISPEVFIEYLEQKYN